VPEITHDSQNDFLSSHFFKSLILKGFVKVSLGGETNLLISLKKVYANVCIICTLYASSVPTKNRVKSRHLQRSARKPFDITEFFKNAL
jgi:hypothetical protein